MSYSQVLSGRAVKDLDRLNPETKERILGRVAQLAEAPHDARFSNKLTGREGLRKSRVGGWRIIFTVDEETRVLYVVTVERRGQVYKRL